MDSKKVNRLYLAIILTHFAVLLGLVFFNEFIDFNIVVNGLVSEGIILIPSLVCLLLIKRPINESLGFHSIKLSSVFIIVLFTILITPLATVCNAVSMFFVENTVASMSGQILQVSFPVMLFLIGIFGPFCEELVFRGIVYRGYRKSTDAWTAGLMSALLFGLMHLNINQMLYAAVIGVAFVLLIEATGSLWSSVIAHVYFNSVQVIMMYVGDSAQESLAEEMEQATQTVSSPAVLFPVLAVTLFVASVTVPLAGCVLVWLAKREGRAEVFKESLRHNKKRNTNHPVSIPLLIAIAIAVVYMSLELFL